MLLHYLRASLRLLKKHKTTSFINILGLSLGLAGAILTILFIADEYSFDRFHTKGNRIYRINKIVTELDGLTQKNAESAGLTGPILQSSYPEIEMVIRYQPLYSDVVLSNDDKTFIASNTDLAFTDSSFFSAFDFSLLEGDPTTALSRPATMVINEEAAKTLFGEENPVGKSVKGLEGELFEITGVIKSPPRNSHLQFKGLISWLTITNEGSPLYRGWMNRVVPQGLCTYLLLRDPSNKSKIENAFPAFMDKHMPDQKQKYSYYLQPFFAVYLQSADVSGLRMGKVGSSGFMRLFSTIAAFVLLIACINYLNISIAHATRRTKEVGTRKSLGANFSQLFLQFMGESAVVTLFASLLAFGLVYIAVPPFNELLDKSLSMSLLATPGVWSTLLALLVVVILLAGAYPALVLSSLKPISSLKGNVNTSTPGVVSRYSLILIQFCISISIIAGTLIIYQQIKFVLDRDLGFDKAHTLVIEMSPGLQKKQKREILGEELRRLSGVAAVSICNARIGGGSWTSTVIPEGFNANEIESRMFGVDFEFANAYGLKIQRGRFFDRNLANDSLAIVINEAMQRKLKWSDPLDKGIKLKESGPTYRVIGVVNDYYYKSLYDQIEPFVMFLNLREGDNITVRFNGNPGPLVTDLEHVWRAHEALYPFNYYFVDERLSQAYQSDKNLLKAIVLFGILSIILSCLGLYGVVSFILENKTKEIGIRKVLGATLSDILTLISRRFIILIALAGLIATPIVILQLDKWLSRFIIKIDLNIYPLVISIILILLIALCTIGIQVWKVGRQSPTVSLKEQ